MHFVIKRAFSPSTSCLHVGRAHPTRPNRRLTIANLQVAASQDSIAQVSQAQLSEKFELAEVLAGAAINRRGVLVVLSLGFVARAQGAHLTIPDNIFDWRLNLESVIF